MREPLVKLENVSVQYQEQLLFSKLNFTLTPHKITCLLGRSGVGKSTLLQLIAGLIRQEPTIKVSGKIPDLSHAISYMAQTDLLLPWLNALDNALLGASLRGKKTKDHLLQAKNLFAQMNLSDALHKFPHELSGGMRQRVALIRTLLEDKPIILMDEPFSALDAITRFELQNLSVELLRGKTVLLVTHDPIEALRIADVILMLAGNPGVLNTLFTFDSATPRAISEKEIIDHQEKLYAALMEKSC